MDNKKCEDLEAAARHLEIANTSLVEAVRALRFHDRARFLVEMGKHLGEMAAHFRERKLNAGLAVAFVDTRNGARAMGRSRSEKKLVALAKARDAKAKNDQMRKLNRELARRRGVKVI